MSNYVWEVSLSCMIQPKTPLQKSNKHYYKWTLPLVAFSFLYGILLYLINGCYRVVVWRWIMHISKNCSSQSSLVLKDSPIKSGPVWKDIGSPDLAVFSQTYFENLAIDVWRCKPYSIQTECLCFNSLE